MSAATESLAWERQPKEGERAYAAFLTYRDLGPFRSLEETRKRLGKTPGYLKPIERWSARRDWRSRARAWDDHLQAERDRVAAQERAKWERRRLQALEEGWQLCRKLRARLDQMLISLPPEPPAVAEPEPAREAQGAIPEAVAPPAEARPTPGRGPSRRDDSALVRLAKLVVELEWALIAEALPGPDLIDPLTATDEEFKAYLVRHPHLARLPKRQAGPPGA